MASPGPSSLGAVSEDRRCLDPQPVSRRACRLRRTLRAPRLIALMSSSSAVARRATGRVVFGASKRRRVARALGLATLCSLALGACGSAPLSAGAGASLTAAAMGGAIDGGTAYFAEQPELPPDYIFPLVSGQYFTVENTADFQTLLYEPLYWFGDQASTSVDYRLSIGNAPVYSDGDRAVTITLKHYRWSDGEEVSARDVIFWINLLKANPDEWASYVPGGFPDNVTSATALNATTVRLELNAAYNPIWYSYNELSQITPLPLSWDRTSISAPAPGPGSHDLPDSTPRGSKSGLQLPQRPGRGPRRLRFEPDLVGGGRGLEARFPQHRGRGDLRPQPALFWTGQGPSGKARRASLHERGGRALGATCRLSGRRSRHEFTG